MRAPTEQVIAISRLICVGCGSETNATCNCGMEYRPKSVRAREAVEANPEKSNRVIAEEIGVDEKTVRKARGSTADWSAVRTGLDGKTRRMPEKQIGPAPEDEDQHEEPDDDDEEETIGEVREDRHMFWSRAVKAEDQVSKLTEALRAKEQEVGRDWPADMKPKQLKKRDEALRCITYWQRELEKLYNEVTGQPAWRVEIVSKDGRRLGNGLRFSTRGEADFYRGRVAEDSKDGSTVEAIACEGERGNVSVSGTNVHFEHGDCVLFNWHPVGGTA